MSAIAEIGNIIASSYMNSIVSFTGIKMIASVPAVTHDMFNAILTSTFIESGQYDDYILDIGEKTRKLFAEKLKESKRAIVNGPMGLFEIDAFSNGTKAIYEALDNYKVKTLIGGGDTAFSVNKLGFKNKFYHVSTGGGATLEYLEGKMLPGIEAIDEK